MALRRILASPTFVFRVEEDPARRSRARSHRVSDLELASRLSFFLWSSIPDDALLDAGGARAAAARRRCSSGRCGACSPTREPTRWCSNFAGQWLHVRNLRTIAPNHDEFPDFDDTLREAFQRETELFFESIVREDRNVLDLLTADYTFVNERLAKHYGIPNVYGSHFRRVTLTDDARRGLLGKGSLLMVTSHADRTAPVLRGKWILENVLGTPPPPPPPNVPAARGERRGGAADAARADGEAPRQPDLRRLPQGDGPARLRARELRRRRRLADARGRGAARCVGTARRRHAGRRRRRAAQGAGGAVGRVRSAR